MRIEPFTIPSEITVSCYDLKFQSGNNPRWLFFLKIKESWRTFLQFRSKFSYQISFAEVVLYGHSTSTPEQAWERAQEIIKAGDWLNKPRKRK